MLDWNWVNLTKVDYGTLNLSEIWLCYIEFEWNLIRLHWVGLKFDYVRVNVDEMWLC